MGILVLLYLLQRVMIYSFGINIDFGNRYQFDSLPCVTDLERGSDSILHLFWMENFVLLNYVDPKGIKLLS